MTLRSAIRKVLSHLPLAFSAPSFIQKRIHSVLGGLVAENSKIHPSIACQTSGGVVIGQNVRIDKGVTIQKDFKKNMHMNTETLWLEQDDFNAKCTAFMGLTTREVPRRNTAKEGGYKKFILAKDLIQICDQTESDFRHKWSL